MRCPRRADSWRDSVTSATRRPTPAACFRGGLGPRARRLSPNAAYLPRHRATLLHLVLERHIADVRVRDVPAREHLRHRGVMDLRSGPARRFRRMAALFAEITRRLAGRRRGNELGEGGGARGRLHVQEPRRRHAPTQSLRSPRSTPYSSAPLFVCASLHLSFLLVCSCFPKHVHPSLALPPSLRPPASIHRYEPDDVFTSTSMYVLAPARRCYNGLGARPLSRV